MSRRSPWAVGVIAGLVGFGAGSLGTYLLTGGPWGAPRQGDLARPEPGGEAAPAGEPLPRLERVRLTGSHVLTAIHSPGGAAFRALGHNAAYRAFVDTNDRIVGPGNPLTSNGSGILKAGDLMTIVAIDSPVPDAENLIVCLSAGNDKGWTQGQTFSLPLRGRRFVSSSLDIAFFEGPVAPRVGQPVTVCQVLLKEASKKGSGPVVWPAEEPLAEIAALPSIKEGENCVYRLTVQIMFMDSGWTKESEQVRVFCDRNTLEKQLSGRQD